MLSFPVYNVSLYYNIPAYHVICTLYDYICQYDVTVCYKFLNISLLYVIIFLHSMLLNVIMFVHSMLLYVIIFLHIMSLCYHILTYYVTLLI